MGPRIEHLYPSLEEKGLVTDDTRVAHFEEGALHAVLGIDRAPARLVAERLLDVPHEIPRRGLERAHHSSESTRLAGLGGAIGLTIHSFLDGVVIGQGVRAGGETGVVLALAVMLHRMADGASAVGVMLGTEHSLRQAFTMLLLTAVAPVLGAAAQSFVDLPAVFFALLLGFFAAMLLFLAVALFFVAGFGVVYAAHLMSH